MSSTTRRLGAVAVAAATTALVLPLIASGAQALSSTTEVVVSIFDPAPGVEGERNFGLSRTTLAGARTELAAGSGSGLFHLNGAADGSRFTYMERLASGHFRVQVRDVSGRLIRTAEQVSPAATGDRNHHPALSPDGSALTWNRLNYDTGAVTLRRSAVIGGAASTLPGSSNLYGATYLNANLLMAGVLDAQGRIRGSVTIPAAGGTRIAVAGLPEGVSDSVLSPDGTKLAWWRETNTTSPSTAIVEVGGFSLTGNTATVTGVQTVAVGEFNYSPTWSRDGLSIRYLNYDGDVGSGDVFTRPADLSTPAVRTSTDGDEAEIVTSVIDNLAPGSAAAAPITLAGTAATVHWTLPSDADLSGVSITRTADGVAPKTVFVAAPTTSFADTGLVLGKTYTYAFTTVDRSGNTGVAASRLMTATAATTIFADPTSRSTTRAPFAVRFSPAASVTVDYRTNSGAFANWLTAQPATARTFGLASAGAATTTSIPGSSYSFRVIAYDTHGNRTGATTAGTAVVPYDQTKAAFSSGTVATAADRWLGSVRTLSAAGSFARITVAGNRFQVIGERCTTCGIFDVYDNNVRVGSVDTRGTARSARQVLFTSNLGAGNHTFVVKARGTAGRPNVVLDGFSIRR